MVYPSSAFRWWWRGRFRRRGVSDGPARDGPMASVERRPARGPGLQRLEGSGRPQDEPVRVPPPDDLEADRQAIGREAAGDAGRRLAGQVEGKVNGRPVEEVGVGPAADRCRALLVPARLGCPGRRRLLRREQEVAALERRRARSWKVLPLGERLGVLDPETRRPSSIIRIRLGSIHSGRWIARSRCRLRRRHVTDDLVESAGCRPVPDRVPRPSPRARLKRSAAAVAMRRPRDPPRRTRGRAPGQQVQEVAVAGRQVVLGVGHRC